MINIVLDQIELGISKMTTQNMPRRAAAYRLDDRVLGAIERLARKSNTSVNKYLENLLFAHGKTLGEIPIDALPLGETRGNKRKPPAE